MDLDEVTIADTFQAAGYATAAFGKWHNGMQYPYHPHGRGFDEYYGFCSGHWGNYFNPVLEHNGQITRGEGFIIDDLTNHAMEFVEAHRDDPFFVYLPLNTPHSPMQVPDRWWQKFQDHPLPMRHRDQREDMPHARAALAMCENIDWNVGRLLRRLDELGLADRTIVVFFHDNGPNGFRWNGDMKGRKGSTDEGGVRSPLLVRWPGRIPAGKTVPQIAGAIDLLPTLAELCGIQLQSRQDLDGVSLKTLLNHKGDHWPDRLIFSHWNGRVSVRSQRYRLDQQGHLFDMVKDPGQRRDVARDHPHVTARLQTAVNDWREELLPGLREHRRPFVIGHPDCRYTQLPARDGVAHGGIQRSNRFPNCSFYSNWRTRDDKITWQAELPADGTFDVQVYYTCPADDIGATIELQFGNARLRGRIQEPHDPPLIGAEHDRKPRAESYVKDFKPLRLGTIELKKGTGELTLRAVEIPGSQVMDFRLLMLTRLD